MIIEDIKVRFSRSPYQSDFYRVWAKIEISSGQQINIERDYPIDHLKSLFDVIWEDMGRELKKALLEQDKGDIK